MISGIVAVYNAVGEQLAHAGDAEYGLNDKGAGDNGGHHGPDVSHHRQQGIAQGVLVDYLEFGDTLAPGSADVVLLLHLHQAGAGQAGDGRTGGVPQ